MTFKQIYASEFGVYQTNSSTAVSFTCFIHASPSGTLEWYKDGHLMEMNENVTIVIPEERNNTQPLRLRPRHTLHLKGMGHRLDTEVLREDRLGIYKCRVKNELGEASAAVEVFDDCNDDRKCLKRVRKQDVQHKTKDVETEQNK